MVDSRKTVVKNVRKNFRGFFAAGGGGRGVVLVDFMIGVVGAVTRGGDGGMRGTLCSGIVEAAEPGLGITGAVGIVGTRPTGIGSVVLGLADPGSTAAWESFRLAFFSSAYHLYASTGQHLLFALHRKPVAALGSFIPCPQQLGQRATAGQRRRQWA